MDTTTNDDVLNRRVDEEKQEEELEKEEKIDTEEYDKLVIELEEIKNKNKELEDQYLRLQADFINFKNRKEKEKENLYSIAQEELLCSLLPILDNFERAIESVENTEDSFFKGMEMIYNQFEKTLQDIGLEEIEALHEKFDPNYHHAAFQQESDEFEEGTVLEVLQKGYKFKDKVIRPTMVKVSK